jgi:hypothetical protein
MLNFSHAIYGNTHNRTLSTATNFGGMLNIDLRGPEVCAADNLF